MRIEPKPTPDYAVAYDFDLPLRTEPAVQPEQEDRIRQLWVAALARYVEDVRVFEAHRSGINAPRRPAEDRGEAWRDFTSAEPLMLRRICSYLDYEPEVVRAGIRRVIYAKSV